jgi:hypothetical protein
MTVTELRELLQDLEVRQGMGGRRVTFSDCPFEVGTIRIGFENDVILGPDLWQSTEEYQVCDKCGRKTWARDQFNNVCGMTQPSGQKCAGLFRGEKSSK